MNNSFVSSSLDVLVMFSVLITADTADDLKHRKDRCRVPDADLSRLIIRRPHSEKGCLLEQVTLVCR